MKVRLLLFFLCICFAALPQIACARLSSIPALEAHPAAPAPPRSARASTPQQRLFPGQRLAVDPNQPAIVLLATREHGLQRSTNGGTHWNLVRSFPAMPLNGIGLTVVAFDKASGVQGQPTPVVFVGVAAPIGSLYRSRDGGKSWRPIEGGPVGLYPNKARFGPDGTLYLSCIGMDGVHGGAVWALNPRTGQWRPLAAAR